MDLSECKTAQEVHLAAVRRIQEITRNCDHQNCDYDHDSIQGGSYTCRVCNASFSQKPTLK